jgi:hypothetical protein
LGLIHKGKKILQGETSAHMNSALGPIDAGGSALGHAGPHTMRGGLRGVGERKTGRASLEEKWKIQPKALGKKRKTFSFFRCLYKANQFEFKLDS